MNGVETLQTGMAIVSACEIAQSIGTSGGALAAVVEGAKVAGDAIDRAQLTGSNGCALRHAIRLLCESATKLEAVAPIFVRHWNEVETLMNQMKTENTRDSANSTELAKKAVKPLQELVSLAKEIAKESSSLMTNLKDAQSLSQQILKEIEREEENRKNRKNSWPGMLGGFLKSLTGSQEVIGAAVGGLLFFAGSAFVEAVKWGALGCLVGLFSGYLALPFLAVGAVIGVGALFAGGLGIGLGALAALGGPLADTVMPDMEIGGTKIRTLDFSSLEGSLQSLKVSTQDLNTIMQSLGAMEKSAAQQQAESRLLEQGVTAGLNHAKTLEDNERLRERIRQLESGGRHN